MLKTSPSSPGIHIPPPYSIPNTRSGCTPPRELSHSWSGTPRERIVALASDLIAEGPRRADSLTTFVIRRW
jgi:hypothetical protein